MTRSVSSELPRSSSGLYEPERLKLMSEALDAALSRYGRFPQNVDLARQIMAAAVVEAAAEGELSLEPLVAAAIGAIDQAISSPMLRTALGVRESE
jgi:hypothetical protein